MSFKKKGNYVRRKIQKGRMRKEIGKYGNMHSISNPKL